MKGLSSDSLTPRHRLCAPVSPSVDIHSMPITLQLVPDLMDKRNAMYIAYNQVASLTLMTYDILFTIADEVKYIWMTRWSFTTLLYVVCRYFSYAVQLVLLALDIYSTNGRHFSPSECQVWIVFQSAAIQILISSVDGVLLLRVYALYACSRLLLLLLLTLLVAEIAAMSAVSAIASSQVIVDATCEVTKTPRMFIAYWIISLVFQTFLFGLTIARLLITARDHAHGSCRSMWNMSSIIRQFLRDGTWAFALIFAAMLINLILYAVLHSLLVGTCWTWLFVVLSFAGSRLLLNPRRLLLRDDQILLDVTTLSRNPPLANNRPRRQVYDTTVSSMQWSGEEAGDTADWSNVELTTLTTCPTTAEPAGV